MTSCVAGRVGARYTAVNAFPGASLLLEKSPGTFLCPRPAWQAAPERPRQPSQPPILYLREVRWQERVKLAHMRQYNKPPLRPEEQVAHLQERGMVIRNPKAARQYLIRTGLLRFKSYAEHFQNRDEQYRGVTFDEVRSLIELDDRLRLHILRGIQTLEISLRTILNEHMTLTYHPHWYADPMILPRDRILLPPASMTAPTLPPNPQQPGPTVASDARPAAPRGRVRTRLKPPEGEPETAKELRASAAPAAAVPEALVTLPESPRFPAERFTLQRMLMSAEDMAVKTQAEFLRSQEDAPRRHRMRYAPWVLPPSWIMAELMTFGVWSRLYSSLEEKDQDAVAQAFGIHRSDLKSWLHEPSVLRNVSAHHARLWNRRFRNARLYEPDHDLQTLKTFSYRTERPEITLAPRLYAMHALLKVLGERKWSTEMRKIVTAFEPYGLENMGFQASWAQREEWT